MNFLKNFLKTRNNRLKGFFYRAKFHLIPDREHRARYIKNTCMVLFLVLSLLLLLPDSAYAAAGKFFSPAAAAFPLTSRSENPSVFPQNQTRLGWSPEAAAPENPSVSPQNQTDARESDTSDAFCERIAEKILRLHILADSDLVRDQEIKLHVRDAVLAYAQPLLADTSSATEAEVILVSLLPELTELANRTLAAYGAEYTAAATISTEFFPIRRYGSLLLPPGSYRALRIILGTGHGHNWWCMLYPSLCFTEGITGTISADGQEKMEQLIDEDDYFLLFSKEEKPEFSFRIAELFAKLKKKSKRKGR